ncbi:MAG: DUF177 domain-containing protein [Synechococcales cyanobacterium RM1_1_8]|nr:DUF177 domain-containing protein [Synechococcales cyanobacterium RM1_1_8]
MGLVPVLQLLQIPEKCLTILVKDHLPGLETLMPVQGEIQLHHKGTFLEVSAQATAIVTLGCDRCLNQYNHRIALDTTEIIWLEEAEDLGPGDALEREIEFEDLVERISPRGSFDPAQWLYEQLCLAIPPQQLCDLDCDGILVETEVAQPSEPAIDHRWAALAQLKQQLPS